MRVNFFSATSLDEAKKYKGRTCIQEKIKYYIFTWDLGKYSTKKCHPENQSGFSNFYRFCKRVSSISKYSTVNFSFASIIKKEDTRTDKTMDFTPEVEIK